MNRADQSGGWRRLPTALTTLWFDAPDRSQNVLDVAALEELDRRLSEIESDSSVRGVLVRSGKTGGFCAGADLKTIQGCQLAGRAGVVHDAGASPSSTGWQARGADCRRRARGLSGRGAGTCPGLPHLAWPWPRVSRSQIGSPEVQLGLIPAWGAIVRLPRLLAPRDALDLLLSGNPLGFLQAKSQGLVSRLVSQDEQERITEVLNRDAIG